MCCLIKSLAIYTFITKTYALTISQCPLPFCTCDISAKKDLEFIILAAKSKPPALFPFLLLYVKTSIWFEYFMLYLKKASCNITYLKFNPWCMG